METVKTSTKVWTPLYKRKHTLATTYLQGSNNIISAEKLKV